MKNLIGRLVEITDKESNYYKHWGYVINYDGEYYHVSGGSISDGNFNLVPIFDRNQFKCPKQYKSYLGAESLQIEVKKK